MDAAREAVLACALIEKADDERFKDLKESLLTNQSQDVGKYPDTMVKAIEFLHDHEKNAKKKKSGTTAKPAPAPASEPLKRRLHKLLLATVTGSAASVAAPVVMEAKDDVPSTTLLLANKPGTLPLLT